MKKKIITICIVSSLLIAAVIGGVMAFLTDNEEEVNTFTVGNVKIDLTEDEWVEPDTVVPGGIYAKNPTVNNTGKNDAYIRVNVIVSDYNAFLAAMRAHEITDLATVFAGYDESKWTRCGEPVVNTANDTVTYSYYYNAAVPAKGTTGAIFTSVKIPEQFTSEEMESLGEAFTITITADAIQAQGFDSVQQAFAAFDEQNK